MLLGSMPASVAVEVILAPVIEVVPKTILSFSGDPQLALLYRGRRSDESTGCMAEVAGAGD